MYLLDTNIASELRKIVRGDGDECVANWWERFGASGCQSSVIVQAEILRGIEIIAAKDPKQAKQLSIWAQDFAKNYVHNQWLPIDSETAQIWAKLPRTQLPSPNDAWIAASGIRHNLTVVTRDEAIGTTGAKILNPWKSQT